MEEIVLGDMLRTQNESATPKILHENDLSNAWLYKLVLEILPFFGNFLLSMFI